MGSTLGPAVAAVLKPKPLTGAQWSLLVLALAGAAFAAIALMMVALADDNRLAYPPFSAIDCVDSKIAFLRNASFQDATIVGVGSSATWRNMDATTFEKSIPGSKAFNAAACHFRINQTAFWSEMILKQTPRVKMVVMYTGPRDWESCDPAETKVLDPTLTSAYLEKRIPGWLVHIVNFNPGYIFTEAFEQKDQRTPNSLFTIVNDDRGWSPLPVKFDWAPAPKFDQRCFAALHDLQRAVRGAGARLVIAVVPPQPSWAAKYDADGAVVGKWIGHIRAEMEMETLLIDGRNFPATADDFADALHMFRPSATRFTKYVADLTSAQNRGRRPVLFSSKIFILCFLPIALAGFFYASRRYGERAAKDWLLFASFVFYGWWSVPYLALLIAWMVGNYYIAIRIANVRRVKGADRSKPWLYFGVVINFALLGYFKYWAFIVDNVTRLTGIDYTVGVIILPLAISFHTFQQVAYLVDVQRGHNKRYKLSDYLLFVSFFPQLIAGPIVHHYQLMPPLNDPKTFRFNGAAMGEGIAFFTMGLIKKLCIADPLSHLATPVFATAAHASPTMADAWVAAMAFSFGLYFDFSGYSDMAIGLARMFSIKLPYNFNSPYQSLSVVDFWRRWHMTLSSWLRDYLYISLGGNRKGQVRRYVNLFITMLLGGLWHGAAWTFLAWGALHGLYLTINHGWNALVASKRVNALPQLAGGMLTYFSVLLAWVFFASPNFTAAGAVLSSMFGANQGPQSITSLGVVLTAGLGAAREQFGTMPIMWDFLAMTVAAIVVFVAPNSQEIIDGEPRNAFSLPLLSTLRFRLNWLSASAAAICLVVAISLMTEVKPFVYFQF